MQKSNFAFFRGQFLKVRGVKGLRNFCANTQFQLSGFGMTVDQYKMGEA